MDNKFILPFPKVLRIEPSSLCNLKCRHCPTGTVEMTRGIMNRETFALIVESIKENIEKVKVVVLYNGGEPLLNKDFLYMLETIKNLKESIFIKINTNGMLLTESLMEGIIKKGLDTIEFSIDGQSPEENNFIRKNSDYHSIVKNIKKLIELKKKLNSDTPKILVHNVQIVEELEKKSGPVLDFSAPIPEFIKNEFEKELANKEVEIQSLYPYVWTDLNLDYDIFRIKEFESKALNYCDSVINTMTIRYNGDVTPCCFDLTSKCVLGNIHKNKLSDIWNNTNYIKLRQSIKEKEFNELCKDCIVICDNKKIILKNKQKNWDLANV